MTEGEANEDVTKPDEAQVAPEDAIPNVEKKTGPSRKKAQSAGDTQAANQAEEVPSTDSNSVEVVETGEPVVEKRKVRKPRKEVLDSSATLPKTSEVADIPVEDVQPEPSPIVEVVESTDLTEIAPKKDSWFKRAFSWFTTNRVKAKDETAPLEEIESALGSTQDLSDADLEMSPTRLRKEIAAIKRELKSKTSEISEIESRVSRNMESIETIDEEVQKLNLWQEESSRTFIARIQSRMHAEINGARSEMAMHEAAVKNLEKLEPGYLLQLRKAFHKSLTIALVLCGGFLTIATLIKFRNELPRLDWLAALYDPNLSGPILVAFLTLAVGAVFLVAKKAGRQKLNLGKVLSGLFLVAITSYLIWDASQTTSFMKSYVNPWLDKHYFEIVSWVASAWVVWVLSTLIVYYRKWSIFQRSVDQQLVSLKSVIEGYVKTQQEIQRLELLHRQTNDWMRILANALFRPWKVNPEWGTSKEFSKHYDTFPFALRVAQALEGNDSRMAELERIIGGHLLKQGWRNKAFEDLVSAVGEDMGLPSGKFTVDFLDHDLPHQTNNSRKLLSKYLEFSARNASQGSVDEGQKTAVDGQERISDAYLVKVAKSRLLNLIEKTQSHAIATARPRVEQIIDDPLLTLRSDESGVDDFDASESWDDFLTDALGAKSVDQFPLGVLTFSEAGRLANLPSKVRTFIAVPKRLAGSLPSLTSDSIEIVPLGDDKPHAVEIIARIDVVGPVEFGDLQLLSANPLPTGETPVSAKAKQEEETL